MCAAVLTAAGCMRKNDTAGAPVVSVEPQRVLLQSIVGDRHEVRTLLAKNANPESFEPTMQTRMALDKAPVYFSTGLLPFEQSLLGNLPANVLAVDCSQGIDLLYGTHGHHHGDECRHGDCHSGADPHIWTSVRNARVMAATMARVMAEAEPENADYYMNNYKALDRHLDSLDRAFARRIGAVTSDRRAFAVWHPSLSYLARDYGLDQIAVGYENKEMSPRHLAEVTEEARRHNVRVFFFQSEFDSRQAESLNRAMGTRMISINPLGADWEAELNTVVDAIVAD